MTNNDDEETQRLLLSSLAQPPASEEVKAIKEELTSRQYWGMLPVLLWVIEADTRRLAEHLARWPLNEAWTGSLILTNVREIARWRKHLQRIPDKWLLEQLRAGNIRSKGQKPSLNEYEFIPAEEWAHLEFSRVSTAPGACANSRKYWSHDELAWRNLVFEADDVQQSARKRSKLRAPTQKDKVEFETWVNEDP